MANVNYQLLVFEGSIGSGDIWSTSIKTVYGDAEVMPFDMQEAFMNEAHWNTYGGDLQTSGLLGMAQDWFQQQRGFSGVGNARYQKFISLKKVKFNSIGPDGKYLYNRTTEADVAPTLQGTGSSDGPGPRQTLCITTRSDISRGRGSRGRMYWPTNGNCITPTNAVYVLEAKASDQLDMAVALIQALKFCKVMDHEDNQLSLNLNPAHIYKDRLNVPSYAKITSVEVDRLVDTQRRRTNRIARNLVQDTVMP